MKSLEESLDRIAKEYATDSSSGDKRKTPAKKERGGKAKPAGPEADASPAVESRHESEHESRPEHEAPPAHEAQSGHDSPPGLEAQPGHDSPLEEEAQSGHESPLEEEAQSGHKSSLEEEAQPGHESPSGHEDQPELEAQSAHDPAAAAEPDDSAKLKESPGKEITVVPMPSTIEERAIDPHLVCLLAPRSEHAESYYRLRYVLESRRRPGPALVVGVTSPNEGDGKTLTAINLAGALAKDARARVLLLDLNLRRNGDGLSDYLGMTSSRDLGVVDWIRETHSGQEQLTHYLQKYNLHVMASGSPPELPYELLKSTRLDELIGRAREVYDFVIIDAPQILRLPDTELISRLVDGFLIVVKAGQTKQERLEEALNLMTEDKVFGLVFNAVIGNQ